MYPARFDYVDPVTVAEALTCLAERPDDDVKVLAGGQSLIPLLKLRFARPDLLVDINRVDELKGVRENGAGGLRIGALVRTKACERSELLGGRWGTLGAAAPMISDPIIRNLGTVCGSLAHADPQGDWGSALLAMDAEVVARGPDGTRTIGLGDVPLLCAAEIDVPHALPRVIRLLAHVETDRPRSDMLHVYLRGAQALRLDIAQ